MNGLPDSLLLGIGIPLFVNIPIFLIVRKKTVGDPSKLMKANVVGFFVKMVLYGAATVMALTLADLNVLAFAITLSGVFVFLHIGEALYFKRLFLAGNSE